MGGVKASWRKPLASIRKPENAPRRRAYTNGLQATYLLHYQAKKCVLLFAFTTMTLPLVIDGTTLTADEFVALQYGLWRKRPRTRLAGWLLLLWVSAMSYFVVRDYLTYHQLTDYFTPTILAVGIVAAFLRGWLVRWQLRRYYARTPALGSPARFELSEAGLRGQGRLSRTETQWAGIVQAQVVGHWLLLYITEATYHCLDLRRLQPPATEADVRALLQAQGVRLVPWR